MYAFIGRLELLSANEILLKDAAKPNVPTSLSIYIKEDLFEDHMHNLFVLVLRIHAYVTRSICFDCKSYHVSHLVILVK